MRSEQGLFVRQAVYFWYIQQPLHTNACPNHRKIPIIFLFCLRLNFDLKRERVSIGYSSGGIEWVIVWEKGGGFRWDTEARGEGKGSGVLTLRAPFSPLLKYYFKKKTWAISLNVLKPQGKGSRSSSRRGKKGTAVGDQTKVKTINTVLALFFLLLPKPLFKGHFQNLRTTHSLRKITSQSLLPPPPGGRVGQKPNHFFRTKIFAKPK